MATPARGPIAFQDRNAWWKTPLLAGLITIALALFGYGLGAIKSSGADEQTIKTLNVKVDGKVDKETYATDMVWMKETLKEMKSDIKDIKKEKR